MFIKKLMLTLEFRPESQNKLTVEQIAKQYPSPGWIEMFKRAEKEIEHMSNILEQIQTYYPPKLRIFRALDLCPMDKVKVIIIGQDPYPSSDKGVPHANGLCFSTDIGLDVQNSLKNIYTEIQNEYPDFVIPKHGDLTEWARQGVLLLNICPTVSPNKVNSHKTYAIGFTARILEALINQRKNHIYLLWGKQAQELKEMIGEKNTLTATHPSGLSAYRASKEAVAFSGCGHFKEVNTILISRGLTPINWQITVDPKLHKLKQDIYIIEYDFRYKLETWLCTIIDKTSVKSEIVNILSNFELHIISIIQTATLHENVEMKTFVYTIMQELRLQYLK